MSDETSQAPDSGTPAVEADTPGVDWEKRYNDLQPEYTRKSQRLSQLESDSNAVLEWVQQYHPDLLADDEEEDDGQGYEEEDDDDPRWARLEQAEKKLAEIESREEKAQKSAEWTGWETFVKQKASEQGVELTGRDIKALKLDSAGKDGWPVEPEKAEQLLTQTISEIREYEQQAYERLKKNRRKVPLPPGDGKTATQTPNLDDPRERVAWMTQQAMDRAAD